MRALANRSLTRFLIVGGTNTAISFAVYSACMALMPDQSPYRAGVAQAFSYLAGMAWGYALNRGWAFDDHRRRSGTLARYVVWQTSLLGLSAAVLHGLVDVFGTPKNLTWFVAMTVFTVINYAGMRHWVFPRVAA